MAYRKWFTPANCEKLEQEDCAILNRAVRNSYRVGGRQPTYRELMDFLTRYKPGMSAGELRDIVESAEV